MKRKSGAHSVRPTNKTDAHPTMEKTRISPVCVGAPKLPSTETGDFSDIDGFAEIDCLTETSISHQSSSPHSTVLNLC